MSGGEGGITRHCMARPSGSSLRDSLSQAETYALKKILLSGKAKTRGMREFILMNDQLSMFLTPHGSEIAFVQRSQASLARVEPGALIQTSLTFRHKKTR